MQDAETFFRICFRCSNSLCCMANLSSPREQGSLIQIPVTKPTFKPPSPKEADLQSYRAVAGFFCYTRIKNEHRTLSFSCSQIKLLAVPVQYIRNIYSVRFLLQSRSAWPEFTVQASYPFCS